jgi:hypothetical protein
MGYRQERSGTQSALDLSFDVVREKLNALRREFGVGELVHGLFEVGNAEHGPELKDLKGVRRSEALLDDIERYRVSLEVLGVLGPPGRVAHQGIQEHGLVFGIGDACRRPLLAKQGAGLDDVGKVGRVSRLVHERVEGRQTAPHRGRIGQARKVRLGGDVGPVGPDPGRDRPVAKAVAVFVLAVQQVECHGSVGVSDLHGGVRAHVDFDGFAKREIGVHFLDDRPRHHVARVPGIQGFLSVDFLQLLPGFDHQGSRSLLQAVQYLK